MENNNSIVRTDMSVFRINLNSCEFEFICNTANHDFAVSICKALNKTDKNSDYIYVTSKSWI